MATGSSYQIEANGTTTAMPPPPPDSSTNGNMTTNPTTGQSLSADEIALYDRQIRLWGAQAQERIRSANILLVSLRALGTEISKNLTLAGISSLTIIDEEPVSEDDLGAGYFFREEDIGKPRAQSGIPRIQDLNPRVIVQSSGSLNDLLRKDQTYYAPFSCVIVCDHDCPTLSHINTIARFAKTPFYAAGIHGFYGYIFADLVAHEFVVEREKSNVATVIGPESMTRSVVSVTSKPQEGSSGNGGKQVEIVKKAESYCPLILANSSPLPIDVTTNRRKLKSVPPLLPCLRALFDFQRTHHRLPDHNIREDLVAFTALATTKSRELQLPPETLRAEFLRSFIQNIGAEIVPTAAFVGGRVSEDVINVLGKREQPVQNFALFDGEGLEGRIYCLFSPPPELGMAMDGMDAASAGGMDDLGGQMGNGMPPQMGDVGAGIGGTGMMGMNGMGDGVMMPMDDGIIGSMPQDMAVDNNVGNATQCMLMGNGAGDAMMSGVLDGAGGSVASGIANNGTAAEMAPTSVPDEGVDVDEDQ